MLNVNDLEKKWRKYKIKSYIPYMVVVTSLSVILVISFVQFSNNPKIDKKSIVLNNKIPDKVKEQIKLVSEQNISVIKIDTKEVIPKTKASDKKSLILSPSLNFMSTIKHSSVYYNQNEVVPRPKVNTKKKITKNSKVQKVVKVEVKKVEKKNPILINRQNTQSDISHVLKRFNKNNNPALSLFVAKKYYELADYPKAYNYALITNEINDNIEASWIIFVKSLVKLNKKDEAVKTLKKYINHAHSNQAKILLDEITSGKFQ